LPYFETGLFIIISPLKILKMANTHKIKIKEGYSNGHLRLKPKHTYAKNKELIRWTIRTDDVTSIESINMCGGTDIFKTLPHRDGTTTDWIAEIKDDLPNDCEYEYSISWNGKYGSQIYDPKISVNPTGGVGITDLLLAAASVLLGLLTLEFLRRKWKRR
jgi:hypothetical protein